MNCEEITQHIKTLLVNKDNFDEALTKGNFGIEDAFDIKARVESLFKNELKDILWPFEILTKKEVEMQYLSQVEVLRTAGLLERLSSGEEGIIDINGRECPLPTLETVIAQLIEKREIIDTKTKQGFTKLLLVPFGKEIMALTKSVIKRILEHKRQNKLLGMNGDVLDLDAPEPLWAWDQCVDAEKENKIVYYPKEYSENHQGKTKDQVLAESSVTPGWQLQLIEDLPDIPRENSSETKTPGGRKQIKAGKSPTEYLTDQQTNPMYGNETFFTPESWLTYFLTHLEETNQVIDDYQGQGSVRYLGASWFPSTEGVPSAYWGRGNRQARLGRRDPSVRVWNCGVGSVVRIT